MNQLNPNSSFETLVDGYGWYAVTRLDGNPELAAVAAEARNMNNDLDQAHLAYRTVARATMSSASARDQQKYKLDAALRNARTAVLSWVHNRRASKYYRAIFPNGLTGALCCNVEEELQIARNVLTKMSEYEVPALAPAIEVLRTAITAVEAALVDYEAALRSREEAWSVVQAAKVTFCQRYYGLYCQVAQILGDAALASTYFRHDRKPTPAPVPVQSDGPEDGPAQSEPSLEELEPALTS